MSPRQYSEWLLLGDIYSKNELLDFSIGYVIIASEQKSFQLQTWAKEAFAKRKRDRIYLRKLLTQLLIILLC